MWRFKSPFYLIGLYTVGNLAYQGGESIYRYHYSEENVDIKDLYGEQSKLALITGATSGLGKGFAERLAERGFDLVLVSRTEGNLQKVQQELEEKYRVKVNYIPFDITSDSMNEYKEFFEKLNQFDIQVFVNNAAVLEQENLGKLTEEQILKQINGNITSPTLLINYFLRDQMKKLEGNSIQKKVLITVGSQSAQRGVISASYPYFATKAYVNYIVDGSIQAEKGTENLIIQNIAPGLIASEMLYKFSDKYKNPNFFQKQYIQSPMDIANTSLTQINTPKVNGTFNQAVLNSVFTIAPPLKSFFM